MAIYRHTYSGLITGGLGGPACCGLITMGFHLFKCTIEVTPPSGGGGGSQPVTEYLIPYRFSERDHTVKITIQFKDHNKKVKTYKVTKKRADMYVKIFNITTTMFDKIQIGVQSIKKVAKTITTNFKNTDK